MAETKQHIHIPIFDQMRGELTRTRVFDRSFSADEFKSILNGSLDAYLTQNPAISVAKSLTIELEGNQARISGKVSASGLGATVNIQIDEYFLSQREPGRLGVTDLKYGLRYNGNILTDLKMSEDGLKKDFETALKDPNTFIWKGLSSQLPLGARVTKFALSLDSSRF